jgi:hypothetical protein
MTGKPGGGYFPITLRSKSQKNPCKKRLAEESRNYRRFAGQLSGAFMYESLFFNTIISFLKLTPSHNTTTAKNTTNNNHTTTILQQEPYYKDTTRIQNDRTTIILQQYDSQHVQRQTKTRRNL